MWILAFYLALVILELTPLMKEAVALLTLPLAIILAVAGQLAARLLAPLLPLPPPKTTPAPPAMARDAGDWLRRPAPVYPLFAQARGQCGWVHFAMRADSSGRVTHISILDQAPDKTFERALTQSLSWARLAAPLGLLEPATTVVSFVMPGPHAPAWARSRLEGAQPAPGTDDDTR